MIFGPQMNRQVFWNLVCGSLLMIGPILPSHACESQNNADQRPLTREDALSLDTIMRNLGQLTFREHVFHETYYSGMLITPTFKEGTLIFDPPARLEKHVRTPTEESFISNGDTLLYENPSREISLSFPLQEYPALATLIEGLRALFSGDIESLRQFFDISVSGTPEDWKLELTPLTRDDEDGVDCIRLAGVQTRLSTVFIQETNGDNSEMRFDAQAP